MSGSVISKRTLRAFRRAVSPLRSRSGRPGVSLPGVSESPQLSFPYRYECRLGAPFQDPRTGIAYPAGYLLLSTDIRSSAVGFADEQREIAALRRSAALFLGESASSCVIASVFYPREVRH